MNFFYLIYEPIASTVVDVEPFHFWDYPNIDSRDVLVLLQKKCSHSRCDSADAIKGTRSGSEGAGGAEEGVVRPF